MFLLFIQHYSCPLQSATDFQPDFVVKHVLARLHLRYLRCFIACIDTLDGDVGCVGWRSWIYTLDVLDGDVGSHTGCVGWRRWMLDIIALYSALKELAFSKRVVQ